LAENKKNNLKVNIEKIDLEKEKDKVSENPGLIAFPHHVGSVAVRPEDKGKIKGRALSAMKEQTDHQMNQLYDQARLLAAQANAIKKRVEISERIYTAQMSFEPIIGHSYFVYEKKNGGDVLSMVAPDEWGRSMPFEHFIAKVKLLSDHTWEVIDQEENGQPTHDFQ
jgi:hypothetical protein